MSAANAALRGVLHADMKELLHDNFAAVQVCVLGDPCILPEGGVSGGVGNCTDDGTFDGLACADMTCQDIGNDLRQCKHMSQELLHDNFAELLEEFVTAN